MPALGRKQPDKASISSFDIQRGSPHRPVDWARPLIMDGSNGTSGPDRESIPHSQDLRSSTPRGPEVLNEDVSGSRGSLRRSAIRGESDQTGHRLEFYRHRLLLSVCDLADLLRKSINPSLYILVDRFFTAVCSCKSPCMIIVNATSSWPVQQSAQSSRKQEKGEFFAGFRMTKQFALVVIRESNFEIASV